MNEKSFDPRDRSAIIYYTYSIQKFDDQSFNSLLADLPRSMVEKINRYKRWQDAQRSLLGKHLLKAALSDYSKLSTLDDILFDKYGKPYLDTKFNFNISHSGELVICVASKDKVGIDIEEIVPIQIEEFKSQFSLAEWQKIQTASDSQSCFFQQWTVKEAVAKADGRGLNILLSTINTSSPVLEGKQWHLKEITNFSGYACHMAHSEETLGITYKAIDFSKQLSQRNNPDSNPSP